MMRSLIVMLLACLLSGRAFAATTAEQEAENVAAFARLYGVVRWFHPSDAAQEIDWNRYAVHGVERVRNARNPRALRRELRALFAPLTNALEIRTGRFDPTPAAATPRDDLVMWMHAGFGGREPYASQRLGRTEQHQQPGYTGQYQEVQPRPLRGKTIRLRGSIRAEAADATSGAALSIFVYKSDGSPGLADEMKDRMVRDPQWHEYAIEGRVDDDAAVILVGILARGRVKAAFDNIVLETRGTAGEWTPVALAAAGFEQAQGWTESGTTRTGRWSRTEGDAPEGRHAMHVTSAATANEPLFDLPAALRGERSAVVSLGRGLSARVPLTLTDATARVTQVQRRALDALNRELDALPAPTHESRAVRLADVVVAWNVYRHFYPYWNEVAVDWDGRLLPLLRASWPAADNAESIKRLEHLTHQIHDGHARVFSGSEHPQRYWLPIALQRIGGDLVVTGSALPTVQVGDIVSTVDGAPVAPLLDDYFARASGSVGWRRWVSVRRIMSELSAGTVRLGLERSGSITEIMVPRTRPQPAPEPRPEPFSELAPGVWYVDLERLDMATIMPRLDTLAQARAIVFDMRGYPTDAGAEILYHLLDTGENTRWMHVPQYVEPFAVTAGYRSLGWDLQPRQPHIGGRVVFLTDARANSYAESVMGYVRDHSLGTIVGAPTAGANGNAVAFTVPSGLGLRFTGMRVTRHDGTTPFHLRGVEPHVPVEPTLEGIRAGRDEVLERALSELGITAQQR